MSGGIEHLPDGSVRYVAGGGRADSDAEVTRYYVTVPAHVVQAIRNRAIEETLTRWNRQPESNPDREIL